MEKYQLAPQERAMMEMMRVPFAIYQFVDKRVVTIVLSDGFLKLFGYEDREKAYDDMDHNMYVDTHPDDVARISNAAFRFATEGGKYEVIYRSKNRYDGGYNVVHAQGEHVYLEGGVRLAHIWYTDEGAYVTDSQSGGLELNRALKKALHEESLLNASYYDFLTGLPSMTWFFELAGAGRDAMIKKGLSPALLFMDLSGMKYYNHRHGFEEGDNLLRIFSQTLIHYFGSENCSRFGQDHFAVVTQVEGLEDKLRRFFADCKKINDEDTLPVRVGIYPKQEEEVSVTTACDRAKMACDAIRNTYVSTFNYYSETLNNVLERNQYIIANLDKAIKEKWIKVYFQPIIRAVNGKVCDEEALARWIDPVLGFLSPADFIPVLENARLIYKLDLYMVEQVLNKIRLQQEAGLYLVPQSINLSRSDFDSCDIVEEIRRRVESAGISPSMLTIEITESIIGSDFDFIKEQVDRFRSLGFPVWMDDFGSGYSSLDVLQSIRFDLIKFDMRFMQQFDQGDNGKIILSEMLKMATSLGIDTICEGVETEDQVRFLREAGCSKLQGYYYEKPIPLTHVLNRYEKGARIGYENPRESRYYEAVGRVNLYDLTVLAREEGEDQHNFFDTLPMVIMEICGEDIRFVRSNRSYRDFMRKRYGCEISEFTGEVPEKFHDIFQSFFNMIKQCCRSDNRAFVDEKMPDHSTVQSFVRRIAVNPVTNTVAVAVVILSVTEADQGTTYASIARALANDYFNLFYVDLETDRFIEYSSTVGEEELAVERQGDHFFEKSREDAVKYLYQEDIPRFTQAFTKENVIRSLDELGLFTITYRLLIDDEPVYVNMKAMRMDKAGKFIIIGVSNVDTQMRQKVELDRIRQEQINYSRFMALSGDYVCMYMIDPVTEDYTEIKASADYADLGLPKKGHDFFAQSKRDVITVMHPDDLPRYDRVFKKENILHEIKEHGSFTYDYRLMMADGPRPVLLKAVPVEESGKDMLLMGVRKI